eukprot:3310939-Amphidinium_carterae.1
MDLGHTLLPDNWDYLEAGVGFWSYIVTRVPRHSTTLATRTDAVAHWRSGVWPLQGGEYSRGFVTKLRWEEVLWCARHRAALHKLRINASERNVTWYLP